LPGVVRRLKFQALLAPSRNGANRLYSRRIIAWTVAKLAAREDGTVQYCLYGFSNSAKEFSDHSNVQVFPKGKSSS